MPAKRRASPKDAGGDGEHDEADADDGDDDYADHDDDYADGSDDDDCAADDGAEGDVLRVMATRVMLVMVLMMMMTTTRTTMVLAFQDVGGEPGPAVVLRESLFPARAGRP